MGGRGGWPWEQGEGPVSASEGAYGCVNLGQGTSRNALPLSSCLQASLSQGLASKDESPLKTHKELSQFRFQAKVLESGAIAFSITQITAVHSEWDRGGRINMNHSKAPT